MQSVSPRSFPNCNGFTTGAEYRLASTKSATTAEPSPLPMRRNVRQKSPSPEPMRSIFAQFAAQTHPYLKQYAHKDQRTGAKPTRANSARITTKRYLLKIEKTHRLKRAVSKYSRSNLLSNLQFPKQAPECLLAREDSLSDGQHRRLANVLAAHEAGLDPNTRKGYNTAVFGTTGYHTFMCEIQRASPWPVTAASVSSWIFWLVCEPRARRNVTYETAVKYLSGLKDHLANKGEPYVSATDEACIKRTIAGVANLVGRASPAVKEAITPQTLQTMASIVDTSDHDNRLALAMSSLGTQRGRRGGEFCARTITGKCWVVHDDKRSATLFVPGGGKQTKNLLVEEIQYFAQQGRADCPVALMQNYLALSPFNITADSPLFVKSDGKQADLAWLREWTTEALAACNISTSAPVRASSWRAGAATASVLAGQPEAITRAIGGWASDAYLNYPQIRDQALKLSVQQLSRAAAQSSSIETARSSMLELRPAQAPTTLLKATSFPAPVPNADHARLLVTLASPVSFA